MTLQPNIGQALKPYGYDCDGRPEVTDRRSGADVDTFALAGKESTSVDIKRLQSPLSLSALASGVARLSPVVGLNIETSLTCGGGCHSQMVGSNPNPPISRPYLMVGLPPNHASSY
jgi:hypothetical protein